ncbi:MAG TPA: redoxin domain-containing protein, partial [archaeon]|nr:redoxin domain-containing protein [archaeon]
ANASQHHSATNANSAVYNFKAATVQGKSFAGKSLAGKPSVLWFWAPWCTICRGESPDLIALAKAFKGKINIVGVASLGPVSDMKDFVKQTHTGIFTHIADPNGLIWSRFQIVSQPSFVLISKSGVPYRIVGSPPKSDLFSLTKDLIKKA